MSRSAGYSEEVRNQILRRLVSDMEAGALGSLEQYRLRFPGHEELVSDEYLRLTTAGGETQAEPARAPVPDPPPLGGFSGAVLQRLSERRGFERYTIAEGIGGGGQGEILRVFDGDLCRNLAMKVLRQPVPVPASPEDGRDTRSLAQFLEEAQVNAQLDHPGIVPVHELGLDDRGRVYFTMKLVKGQTLQEVFELVASGAEGWTQTRALSVLLRVCEAMAYAHAKGVIHRDLKPSNVMVGRYGEVYVMDWGLARTLDRPDRKDVRVRRPDASTIVRSPRRTLAADSPDSDLVTMDGDVIGTPAYMSPEQAQGRVDEMGPSSDVYAVGALLYHLLAGHKPYVEPGMKLSGVATWYQVQKGPPEALGKRAPDAPTELVAICGKAMAREWRERYGDMGELAEDLRAFLEHRVVAAYRVGALMELRKWVERNRALAAASAVAVLALVLGLGVSLAFKARSDRARALAESNERRAREAERVALQEGQRAEREQRLATERADEVLRLSALQKLSDLVVEAERAWPARPETSATLKEWIARAEALLGELPLHEAQLAALRAKARPWTEDEREELLHSHPKAAELARTRRHLEFLRAQDAAARASAALEDPTPDEAGVDLDELRKDANELNSLAWRAVNPERGDWGDEKRGLVLSRRAVELSVGIDRTWRRDTLAWALFAAGRFDEAVQEMERAMEDAGPEQAASYEDRLRELLARIEEQSGPSNLERMVRLQNDVEHLEREVCAPTDLGNPQENWWHNQLAELVEALRDFSHPDTGLASAGISPVHGWGVRRRSAFAETIADRTLHGPEARRRWAEACASLADRSECPLYGGLELAPQLGLLPIGRDPDSGLWEFAHLQTGEPAGRGPDGRLSLREETGLVFVLLPGGTFRMGAQSSDPRGPNFDPEARTLEGPVREMTLTPFFLSKFEMTQGQWLRFTGENPSCYKPSAYSPLWNAEAHPGSLLLPVEQVSWARSHRVLSRMELLLPSETQWEYAARAGTATPWWTGDERESLAGAANLADRFAHHHGGASWLYEDWLDDGNTAHAAVGSYRANAFGLHDVAGNAIEWCLDGYEGLSLPPALERDPLTDPAASIRRAFRGGSSSGLAGYARSTHRAGKEPGFSDNSLGLRPARRVTP